MPRITPKNWREFQHYKDRNPPWIRLHRKLLDDKDFHRLPVESRALAPMLWLLAAESVDGSIEADPDDLAFRLRTNEKDITKALKPLIERGFFVMEQGASNVLAGCKQLAPESCSETEALQRTETEAETETEATQKSRASRSATPSKPDDVSEQVWTDWCALRKAKKSTVSETVLKEARAEAAKAHLPLERFLSLWCARGSQGLIADWLKPHERGVPTMAPRDRIAAANAEANAEAARLLGFNFDPTDAQGVIDA